MTHYIICDIPTVGFCKYVANRLKALGFELVLIHEKMSDYAILELAKKLDAIILTTDRDFKFMGYDKVILLPQGSQMYSNRGKPKRRYYEEWWTILCKQLHELRKRGIV